METGIIAIIVFAVVLLIVISSALAKRKKLNGDNSFVSDELNRESIDQRPRETTRKTPPARRSTTKRKSDNRASDTENRDVYSSLLYYVHMDGVNYGPFSLEQLKTYPLLEDTLITTNTLNGTWYEAKYFECLDDLFRPNLPFRIDADGTIIRS